MPATAERRPAVETVLINVLAPVSGPDGVSILEPGRHSVPADHARKLVAAGKAQSITPRRFVATSNVVVGPRVVDRGEVLETADAVNEDLVRAGYLVELRPGESIPAALPAGPNDQQFWERGAFVTCEAIKVGPIGAGRAGKVGEQLKLRESDACEAEANGLCRVVDALSPAGLGYKKALASRQPGQISRPSYTEFARKARRAAAVVAPTEDSPRVKCKNIGRIALPLAGGIHPSGSTFRAPEAMVALPFLDGRVELTSKPSARFDAYVRALADYKASIRNEPNSNPPYPSY